MIRKQANPENNIPPGTPFDSLPDDWTCPVYGTGHVQSSGRESKGVPGGILFSGFACFRIIGITTDATFLLFHCTFLFCFFQQPFLQSPPVSYTHLRAHETDSYLVCRLLLEKKKKD